MWIASRGFQKLLLHINGLAFYFAEIIITMHTFCWFPIVSYGSKNILGCKIEAENHYPLVFQLLKVSNIALSTESGSCRIIFNGQAFCKAVRARVVDKGVSRYLVVGVSGSVATKNVFGQPPKTLASSGKRSFKNFL